VIWNWDFICDLPITVKQKPSAFECVVVVSDSECNDAGDVTCPCVCV